MPGQPEEDRRRFRRVQAPILARPAGPVNRALPRLVRDISLGGLRTYSDESYPIGARFELDLLFEDGSSITVLTEVAWVQALEPGAVAKYDLGLSVVNVAPEDLARLKAVMSD
jgi:hypothetical protein